MPHNDFLGKDRPLIQKWSHKIKTEPKNSYRLVTGVRGDAGVQGL